MTYKKALEASDILGDSFRDAKTGIFLGTGLGNSAGFMKIHESIPYSEIPHFPSSTVESHAGELLLGEISGKKVIIMRGRFHLYEGYSPLEVSFPVRLMQVLGIENLIVTNASGGLNPEFNAGDIMIIEDHINLTGENPLVGANDENFGERFPDMSCVYDPELKKIAAEASKETKIPLQKGVYAGLKGPSLETPAENRFLKTIGADAVGMSTVCEVIAAKHGGMKILGLSLVTNINNPDNPEIATIEEIIDVAGKNSVRFETLLKRIMEKI